MNTDKYIDKSGYVRYYKGKRLAYNKELFPRHKAEWTINEIRELVNARPQMKYEDIGLMLERTPDSCRHKYAKLKKSELLEFYRNI